MKMSHKITFILLILLFIAVLGTWWFDATNQFLSVEERNILSEERNYYVKQIEKLENDLDFAIGANTILSASNEESFTLPELVEEVIGGVVHIQCEQWQGSGFVVGPRLIKTARHVVKGQTDFVITTVDGHVIKATRAILSRNHDIGYIYIDDLTCISEAAEDISCRKGDHEVELQILEFGNFSDCKLGEDVFAIGGSLGKQHFPNLTSGIISNLNLDLESFGCPEKMGWSVMWMTDTATYGGNSGCPVFNMNGEVVGVLVGGHGNFESTSYCIPVDIFVDDIDIVTQMFIQDKYQIEKISDNHLAEMRYQIINLHQQISYLQQDNENLLDMHEWFLSNREFLDGIIKFLRNIWGGTD